MKVICIDAAGFIENRPLVEGEVYDACQSSVYPNSFVIKGFERTKCGKKYANYQKWRFLTLSDIDETQLVTKKEALV